MIYGKKLPYVILLLAAGMAGCIKEREVETPGGKTRPVVFAPQVSRGGESRAATGHPIENGATIPVGEYHFGVYAWVKPTSVAPVEPFAELQNAKVRHASPAEYTYDPVASWPRDADARLACMAYYPWSDQTGNIRVTTGAGANQTMTINYTIPASSADHVDLMYAKTAMTAGYDPVNLDFRHALARLKFEGRTEDFPAGSTVKITGIRIANAVMRGDLVVLDPATQPGKPWWELSANAGDKGAITMPAAHIKDLALTATLQSVITPGGDMLVIPQTVDGLTVEVSASLNGTSFPEPFVFSLTSSPEWTMNEIITYEITLMPDGMHLTAKVSDWTTDPVNIVYDGQYYMELNRDRLDLYKEGGGLTLEIKTDYDKINAVSGEAGSYLDVSGIGTWATVTDLGQTLSGGEYTRRVRIEATAFDGATDQTPGKFIVKAGNLNYVFHLTQSKDSWLTATDDIYFLDGGLYTTYVTSNYKWLAAIDETSNLINGKRAIDRLVNPDGTNGIDNPLSFVTYDDIGSGNPVMLLETVNIVFTDIEGVNKPRIIPVMLTTCENQKGKEANCYLIDPTQKVGILIPVRMANGCMNSDLPVSYWPAALGTQIANGATFGAKLVWTDAPGTDNKGLADNAAIRIVKAAGSGQNGYLAVIPGNAQKEGNAVVAITRNTDGTGDILWSWHIWVNKDKSTILAGDYSTGNPAANIWMNRNLGALNNAKNSSTAFGLMYQWGRKDAFPHPAVHTWIYDKDGNTVVLGFTLPNDVVNSVRFPITSHTFNLWNGSNSDASWGYGDSKTIFDPCPKGWRVTDPTRFGMPSDWSAYANGGWIFNPTGQFFPLSGEGVGGQGTVVAPASMFLWTDRPASSQYPYEAWKMHSNFTSISWTPNAGGDAIRQHKGRSYGIRCVAE